MKYKIGICGYFADGLNDFGGQPVKTRIIEEELSMIYGNNKVMRVDTASWKKRIFSLISDCLKLSMSCDNIIILPARNGVRVFTLLFLLLNKIFKRKIHYIVIGGWLVELTQNNCNLKWQLKKLDGIYVETYSMVDELRQLGFLNVHYMPNLKRLTPVKISEFNTYTDEVKNFCTFSRVIKEKGIEDAIKAIIDINTGHKEIKCNLDIYGPIPDNYKEKFGAIMINTPSYIVYKGIVKPTDSVEVLKNYYMQLFPTRYRTEGIPGSILDSLFAGLPVLASRWNSYNDVIVEGITGMSFEFGSYIDLKQKLEWCIENPDIIHTMRTKCVNKSEEYTPNSVMSDFMKFIR